MPVVSITIRAKSKIFPTVEYITFRVAITNTQTSNATYNITYECVYYIGEFRNSPMLLVAFYVLVECYRILQPRGATRFFLSGVDAFFIKKGVWSSYTGIGTAWAKKEGSMRSSNSCTIFWTFSEQNTRFLNFSWDLSKFYLHERAWALADGSAASSAL